MSRIGKKPIELAKGVTAELRGSTVHFKGAEGEIAQALPPMTSVEIKDGVVNVTRENDAPQCRAYHGLARSLLANAAQGVAKKFEKKLEIVGIGYRASMAGDTMSLSLGHSHPIDYKVPNGIQVEIEKQTLITIKGIDKQLVGQVAANIRDMRRPDMYKGKGVRYAGEQIKQKVGKSGAA